MHLGRWRLLCSGNGRVLLLISMCVFASVYLCSVFIMRKSVSPLIEPFMLEYLITNKSLCVTTTPLTYILYVLSADSHFDRRQILRTSWAQNNVVPGHSSRTVFIVGRPTVTKQVLLELESQQYGDIIQVDIDDCYDNLSIKSVMGLQWISTYCTSHYVIKADDDVILDMHLIVSELLTKHHPLHTMLLCRVVNDTTIQRWPMPPPFKWHLPEHLLVGQTMYPRYCDGRFFVMSPDLPLHLYKQALSTPLLPIDDVFVTGILTEHIKGFLFVNWDEHFAKNYSEFIESHKLINKTLFICNDPKYKPRTDKEQYTV